MARSQRPPSAAPETVRENRGGPRAVEARSGGPGGRTGRRASPVDRATASGARPWAAWAAIAAATAAAVGIGWRGTGPGGTTLEARPASPAPAAESRSQAGGNTRPLVTGLRIEPAAPSRLDTVRAVVEASDPDGDLLAVEYRWTVNRVEVPETGPTLSLLGREPGDEIAVRVTPSDASGAGAARVSAPVSVANLAPAVTRLVVEPAAPRVGEAVRLGVEGRDAEEDPVDFLVEWLVNGAVVPDQRGPQLAADHVRSGARIQVVVTPQDAYSMGAPVSSPVLVVANRSPEIRSTPPTRVTGSSYRYPLVAADPDGDVLTYVLEQGPAGMTVDARLGEVEWTPASFDAARAQAWVRVEDGKGGIARQQITIDLRPAP